MEMLDSRVHSCRTFSRLQFGRERRAVSWDLFWVGSVNHHSHRLRLKQSQTKGERMASWGKRGGKGGLRLLRQVCPYGVTWQRQREGTVPGASQECGRGAAGLHQAPRHSRTDDPTLPTVKVNPPTRVPVEASHSRKAQGDHGHAGGPAAAGAWSSGLWLWSLRGPGAENGPSREDQSSRRRGQPCQRPPTCCSPTPVPAAPPLGPPRIRLRPRTGPASRSAPLPVPPPPPPTSCPAPPQGRIQQDPASESLASGRVG